MADGSVFGYENSLSWRAIQSIVNESQIKPTGQNVFESFVMPAQAGTQFVAAKSSMLSGFPPSRE
jgi:hypothetical protein